MALLSNKRAHFDYDILDTYRAGIKLKGGEVKSLRAKHGSLNGSYISSRADELWLVGAHIPIWQNNNNPNGDDPYRPRKLLLHKKELKKLKQKLTEKGLTIIPLSLYNRGRHIKLDIALARGKKKHDKRETVKQRQANREIQRTLKNMNR